MKYVLKQKKVIEKRNYKRMELAKSIILALGKGTVILSLLLAPNVGRMLKIFGEDFLPESRKNYNRSERIKRAIARLKRKRFVEIYEKSGKTVVELTETGKKRLLVYQLETLELTIPKKWDGRWRFVMFDIPETKNMARKALVSKLRAFGFLKLQKSVWVFPYPCHDEIDFVSEIFGVGNYINYIEAAFVDDEQKLKLHFFKGK